MQLSNIRLAILFSAIYLFSSFSFMSAAPTPSVENNIVEKIYNDLFVDISDEELENRIMSVTNLLEPKFTAEVKGYLRVYLTSRPQWTQILLGRTSIYFPIFEKKIEEKGMPNDVKFISIIESALRTDARSRVGAQGLWQFMPGTAKDNRLVIDKYVDERDDPYRATDAALEYLSSLYGRYNDWALAIAAYNSGPGRVNQAIAISGSRNFWQMRNYLPKETRNYVPAFLAAAYMMKYYSEYYISPETPRLDFQITRPFKIYDELTFEKISAITGLSISDVKFLNTSFRKDVIPTNSIGYTLLLPSRVANKMDQYLNNVEKPDHSKAEDPQRELIDSSLMDQVFYDHVLYDAQPGEKLKDIADMFKVDKYNIRHWNSMSSDDINPDQPMVIHYIKNENHISVNNISRKFVKRNKVAITKIPSKIQKLNALQKAFPAFYNKVNVKTNEFQNLDLRDHYRLRRGESFQDVIRKNPNLSLEDMQAGMIRNTNPAATIVIPISK
jgi:membrane-bound lytic murein transglycosylase D